MAIKKNYLKSKPVCKVTFVIPKVTAKDFNKANIVGDFNNWDVSATPMKKSQDGSFKVTLDLSKDSEHQFRYVLDDNTWMNEIDADKHVVTYFLDSENSVLVL